MGDAIPNLREELERRQPQQVPGARLLRGGLGFGGLGLWVIPRLSGCEGPSWQLCWHTGQWSAHGSRGGTASAHLEHQVLNDRRALFPGAVAMLATVQIAH